ncbi:hypothetical protein OIU79_000097 [Salix purpurea]|uniref:Uncharacterized protein n=1 Tax=Salix purpurea TaxID=77065 RepID=A0A9Q0V0H2_SALPP|nr:hypothetical protein OIU79_000097 [Salix purpurea]
MTFLPFVRRMTRQPWIFELDVSTFIFMALRVGISSVPLSVTC